MSTHFVKEFRELAYVLRHGTNILLFAHTRPDPDAVGSVVALKRHIQELDPQKTVTIACFSPFPRFVEHILSEEFLDAATLDYSGFDVAIGADSVERGFSDVLPMLPESCVTVMIDHHAHVPTGADIVMSDHRASSACEILYDFFQSQHAQISPEIAKPLMLGIVGDTGSFHHNTSPRVFIIAADLIRRGASIAKIVNKSITNRSVQTLRLWGRALARAQFFEKTGLLVTAIASEDLSDYEPTAEEIKEVASILATEPRAQAVLMLFQSAPGKIKASLRTPEHSTIDVSDIAAQFGGGGHPAASGFEISGTITVATDGAWQVA